MFPLAPRYLVPARGSAPGAAMKSTAEVVRVKGAFAWVDGQRSIHLKAVEGDGKPVELSVEDARLLADRLRILAQTLEALQSGDGRPGPES